MIEIKREGNKIIRTQKLEDFIINEYKNNRSRKSLADELGVSPQFILKILNENNIYIRTLKEQQLKYKANEDYFEKIDTEEKAYWLGFIYADGSISNGTKQNSDSLCIVLHEKDFKHLEKFKKAIGFTGEVKHYKCYNNPYSKNPSFCRIKITSNKLVKDLIDKGCLRNKSKILKYPSNNIVPKHLENHFIRGLIDGDGSIIITKDNDFHFCLIGTYEICKGVLKFLNKENLTISNKSNNCYQITISGNKQSIKLLNMIYKDATIYLDRKYEKYLKMLEIKSQ